MRWLLTLAICLPLFAQTPRSLVTDSGEYGTASFSSTALGSFSIAVRIHGYATQGSDRALFSWGGNNILYIASGTLTVAANTGGPFGDGAPDGVPQVTLTGSDARILFRRDLSGLQETIEVWDGACSASSYTSSIKTISAGSSPTTSASYTVANGAMNTAFVRMYGSAITAGVCPADAPTSAADVFDYTFESDVLTDRSGNGRTLTATGATYMNSPTSDCSATFLPWLSQRTVKTTGYLTLTSQSFCNRSVTGVPTSFSWSQSAGTGSAVFGSASASSTTFSNSTTGTKTIQLQVGDGTGTTTTTNKIGVVAVGSDGCTVTQSNSNLEAVIGPVVIFGDSTCSPWTYWDWLGLAEADQIPPAALGNDDVVDKGALVSGGPFTVTSANPPHITSASSFTGALTAGQWIVVGWDSVDGADTGRYVTTVAAINSSTDITLDTYYFGPCQRSKISCPATVTLYQPKTAVFTCAGIYSPCFNYSLWGIGGQAGSTNWNYYDLVLSLYRIGVRTGIDTYTNYAKSIADLWWTWALDHGAQTPTAPRVQALGGAIARAVDGDGNTARVGELYSLITSDISQDNIYNTISLASSDKRETGYSTGFLALAARFDSTHRASYCTSLQSMVDSWISVQAVAGFWQEDLFAGGYGYPNSTIGGSPWRQAIATRSLEYTYEALVDASVCNDTTGRPATLLTAMQDNLAWVYNAGRSTTNRGIYYNASMGTQTLNNQIYGPAGFSECDSGMRCTTGTVDVTNGSTTVTGHSTLFVTNSWNDGTHYLAPKPDNANFTTGSNAVNHTWVVRIASCSSNASCTLATPWVGPSFSGATTRQYQITSTASSSCGAGSAPDCENDDSGTGNANILPGGMSSLLRLTPGNFGWMYRKTGNSTWKTRGDELFSATFGGPASGPGYTNACAGPACDGTVTDTAAALRDCASYSAPCTVGGNAFAYNATKNFPEAGGWADADRYLSDRLVGSSASIGGSRITGSIRKSGSVRVQ